MWLTAEILIKQALSAIQTETNNGSIIESKRKVKKNVLRNTGENEDFRNWKT